jgi:hypothetical protein
MQRPTLLSQAWQGALLEECDLRSTAMVTHRHGAPRQVGERQQGQVITSPETSGAQSRHVAQNATVCHHV